MEGRSHFEGHICSISPCAEGLMTETRGHGTERHDAQGLIRGDMCDRSSRIRGKRRSRHYGRVVKATDSNFVRHLFPYGSAGSNPAGVVIFLLFLNIAFVPQKPLNDQGFFRILSFVF